MKSNIKRTTNLIAVMLAVLLLASCGLRPVDNGIVTEVQDTTAATDPIMADAVNTVPAVTTAAATSTIASEHYVGMYFDMEQNGNYSRITEWRAPWNENEDIVVFDIIPSSEELLTGYPYKDVWKAAAEETWGESTVRNRFELYYKLNDGTEYTFPITKPSEAEKLKEFGHIEVYLYDDIHQEGGWYSHLTDADIKESSVISSVKLTAGEKISQVESIFFRAYPGVSEDYSEVELIRIR